MALEIITSDVLTPLRHGFFSRKGGASSGLFSGLNCGYGSSDQKDIVAINRARVAHAMGGDPQHLIGPIQTHSAQAVYVDQSATDPNAARPEGDGIVTDVPGVILLILTADCAPVLFADTQSGVIGAAHAGWRGAIGGVLTATIEKMVEFGAKRDQITAVVGPTISQTAYEVGPEFRERFINEASENDRFFVKGVEDRVHFDLPAFVCHALRQAGIGHAEWTRHCTYSDPESFFSFRRSVHQSEPDYGRLASAIRL